MTVIFEWDQAQLQHLATALPGTYGVPSLEDLGQHLRDFPFEFAVVIGPTVDLDEATAFSQWAQVQRPDLGVILVRHSVDTQTLAVAMRSGMREAVESADLAGLAAAVDRVQSVATAIAQTMDGEVQAAATAAVAEVEAATAAAQAAAAAPKGKIHTVFSTKGGVGKTTIATNLAVAIADRGMSVMLVDLDLNNGDVAIMLQLKPARTINDLVAFNGLIDTDTLTTLGTRWSDNLSVVAGPATLDSPDKATPQDIGALLEVARRQFDHVIVDTGGVFDDAALAALDISETIILVGTLDIPALKGLKLAVGTLDLLNFPRETWRLVINRADSKIGLGAEEYQSTLGLKAETVLTSSREVLAAVNRGETLVKANPAHPNSRALTSLAASLIGVPSVEGFVEAAAPAGRLGSRLRLKRS